MNTQSLKENGRKGGQKRAAAYHQRVETVIHFGGHTTTNLPNDFKLALRGGRVDGSLRADDETFVGWTVVNKPQIGRRLRLRSPTGTQVYRLPWLIAHIERRPIAEPSAVMP